MRLKISQVAAAAAGRKVPTAKDIVNRVLAEAGYSRSQRREMLRLLAQYAGAPAENDEDDHDHNA